ncbi:MAG: efflux RND transporter permease subunit, partial [Candidatus Omnitrophica bacterium]|nr:efflux RND transporter permease subunit [Candidatus Omnitrophota bacterium]
IDIIKERIPREAEETIVLPFNPFDKPIMILSITSSGDRSSVSLKNLVKKMIKDELEKVEGVASATISGGLEREIQVEVDQNKLQSRGIPILDVSKAIGSANLNYPAGTIKETFYEYLIRTLGEFQKVQDIEEVALTGIQDDEEYYRSQSRQQGKFISEHKKLIYVKDIATVVDGLKERTSYSRYNGKENISLAIQKQATGNTVKTVDKVKRKIEELKNDIPKDIQIAIVYDQSVFIKSSIRGVWDAAWQGGLLVFVVLFYFLRNVWSALIVTLTIPISVMATFALMFFSGITINMMSLGGLAFGVGSLVDCAIVVVENIFRHMQMGKGGKEAANIGANEVFISVTGSVLTTVVVFLPLIFVVGIIGQISKDFALTVTFSLVASLIASVTIIPLLASRSINIGKDMTLEGDDISQLDHSGLVGKVRRFYAVVLDKYMRHKLKYLSFTILIFLASLTLFIFMDKELMPKVDQGQFAVKIDMPTGTRLEVTNRVSERVENYIMSIPEVESVNVTVGSTKESATKSIVERLGPHQAEIVVNLKKKRTRKSQDVVQEIQARLEKMDMEGARVEYVLQENVLSTGMGVTAPVTIELKGAELKEMEEITRRIEEGLEKIQGVYSVKDNLAEPSPETKVIIDKDKASVYGLSVTDIAQTALIGLKGYIASKLKEKGEEYDIRVRLREQDRNDFEKLSRLERQSPAGIRVNLGSVAKFGKGKGPSEIKRLNQERVVNIYGNVYNRPMKDVYEDVNTMLKGLNLPKGYYAKLTGETEEMKESFDSMRNAIIAAFLLVYMIMAALFESLWQPFIIMFTIPLSLIGVAIALMVSRTTVSAYVLMGVGILGGIVVNNAIVLIDCINLFKSKGMSDEEAAVNASKIRLRPILMTALTTILGLAPMAFLGGEGAELRAPMAITVMGGLTVATFLTLIVIPTIYVGVVETTNKIFKKKQQQK